MDTGRVDFSANIERFTGFADHYDQHRPQPPAILGEILTSLARASYPELVVDLGSGTGLSTRYWADKARRVVGIEPTLDMRRQAERQTRAENVAYQAGFSHQTGLPGACAQIVTCFQALHWMEPQGTFEEARRILVPGGVFAACDYDWPPTTGSWEADAAYLACSANIRQVERAQPDPAPLKHWGKEGHLARMAASGCFRFTKEIVLHHIERGNAARLIGVLLSQGSVQTLLKNGITESQLGIDVFRAQVQRALGDEPLVWYWSARLRLGIV